MYTTDAIHNNGAVGISSNKCQLMWTNEQTITIHGTFCQLFYGRKAASGLSLDVTIVNGVSILKVGPYRTRAHSVARAYSRNPNMKNVHISLKRRNLRIT